MRPSALPTVQPELVPDCHAALAVLFRRAKRESRHNSTGAPNAEWNFPALRILRRRADE
jgi:hypothetical protein